MTNDYSRRSFIAASGAAFGAAWLAADAADLAASHERMVRARTEAVPLEVLTPEQAADLEAIAAQIIPTDELPGAREARVVAFIDHSLATWARDQARFLVGGLDGFNIVVGRRYPGVAKFSALDNDRQVAFLRSVEQGPVFQAMRFAVLAGMFSHPSRGGNFEKAGWRMLGFDDRGVWQPPFGWYDANA